VYATSSFVYGAISPFVTPTERPVHTLGMVRSGFGPAIAPLGGSELAMRLRRVLSELALKEEAIMRVLDLMTPAVIAVGPTTQLRETLQLMLRRQLNNVLVIDNQQRLLGIVTYSDLSRKLLPSVKELAEHEEYLETPESMEDRVEEIAALRVDQIMTKDVITVSPDIEVLKAGATMTAHRIKQAPVVRDHKVVGIISHTDIGWGLMLQYAAFMKAQPSSTRRAGK